MPVIEQSQYDIDATGALVPLPDAEADYDWGDLLWGALTVGRRSLIDVFAFGQFSLMEMIWRAAMVRANLETDVKRRRIHYIRNEAFNALDGSEKGAITYFFGLMLAKLSAESQFDTPWLWHLDVYSKINNAYGAPATVIAAGAGRSRPDLVGQTIAGNWMICESKGRTHSVADDLRLASKEQTRQISLINGVAPTHRIASIARFRGNRLSQELIDPLDWVETAIPLTLPPMHMLEAYYDPFFTMINHAEGLPQAYEQTVGDRTFILREIPAIDIVVGLDAEILETQNKLFTRFTLMEGDAEMLLKMASLRRPKSPDMRVGRDGVLVAAGASWRDGARQP